MNEEKLMRMRINLVIFGFMYLAISFAMITNPEVNEYRAGLTGDDKMFTDLGFTVAPYFGPLAILFGLLPYCFIKKKLGFLGPMFNHRESFMYFFPPVGVACFVLSFVMLFAPQISFYHSVLSFFMGLGAFSWFFLTKGDGN